MVPKIVLGVAILLVIAFAGYRRTLTLLPIGARLFFLTGTEYIFVGFALGDSMIGLLDEWTVRSLSPLYGLGLGLIGLIFGIQLEIPKLRRFPAAYLRVTVVQAVVTMAVVFLPSHLFLRAVFGGDREVLTASLVLAATAACTAQSALALIGKGYELTGARVMDLLRYVSSLDAAFGLLLFGIAFCMLSDTPALGIGGAFAVQRFAMSLALGGALGFLLHVLTRFRCGEEELLLFVTGTVLFSAGIASYLRLSPLFVNLIMGAVAAGLPGSKTRILNLLALLEKPFYVVFLLLAGAIWRPGSTWALALGVLYLALRLAGKLLGGYVATRSVGPEERPPAGLGLGLVSQGGVVIAMVTSYYQASPTDVAAVAVTAVLIGVIVSELLGPSLARGLLLREGELPA